MFGEIKIIIWLILFIAILITVLRNYVVVVKMYIIETLAIFCIIILLYSWTMNHNLLLLIISIIIWISIRGVIIPAFAIWWMNVGRFDLVEKKFKISSFFSLLIGVAIISLVFMVSEKIFWDINNINNMIFFWSISLLLLGIFVSINHNSFVSNIITILTIENAVLLMSVLVIDKVWFSLELWILLDIMFSFMVMFVSVFKIKQSFWTEIYELSELRD